MSSSADHNAGQSGDARHWVDRYLADLAVVCSANTVRAYRQDLGRWVAFCRALPIDPLEIRPQIVIAFVRAERARVTRSGQTVGARTVVRRLAAIRGWYAYLALEPEQTGVRRNPVPGGTSLQAAAGVASGKPALLRYDRTLPQLLPPDAVDRFIGQLTTHRDRALVWLLKDGAVRIGEALALRVGDIAWGGRRITVRATKTRRERVVQLSHDVLIALGNYLRLERPQGLDHDHVFVCLGRRSRGRPLSYRAWVYVCEQARRRANTPDVHAHLFRHTRATDLAEAGMPLDSLQRQLGHADIRTTMVYNHVRPGRLRRDYERAAEALEADRRRERRYGAEGGR
jgi:site-specific recombinase XerD